MKFITYLVIILFIPNKILCQNYLNEDISIVYIIDSIKNNYNISDSNELADSAFLYYNKINSLEFSENSQNPIFNPFYTDV